MSPKSQWLKSSKTSWLNAFVVQIKLDLTGNVLNGGEAGFAHLTFEHHAAGNFDGNALRVEFFFADFTVLGMQVGGQSLSRLKSLG